MPTDSTWAIAFNAARARRTGSRSPRVTRPRIAIASVLLLSGVCHSTWRAAKGQRLRVGVPHGHWKTTTFVAGLRINGMVHGPRWADQRRRALSLCRTVSRSRTEARRHRDYGQSRQPQGRSRPQRNRSGGRAALHLPPYSPNFNPIENAFAKLKAPLRKAPNEPSTAFGTSSAQSSKPSLRPNAQTTSPPRDTMHSGLSGASPLRSGVSGSVVSKRLVSQQRPSS